MSVQEMGGSITNMRWQPPLIRLTQVSIDCVDGGASTTCYVAPDAIYQIHRSRVWSGDKAGEGQEICCTEVYGAYMKAQVLETPEEICRLRDEALGFKPTPPTTALRSV